MVETFDEKKELEMIKHNNKVFLSELGVKNMTLEHDQKMIRLTKIAEISKDGQHLRDV